MIAPMVVRGPDDNGVWADERAAIGHCRLAIMDPPAGRQPMVSEGAPGHTVVLSYGGEIYNHKELRGALTVLGHQFLGKCDTEVILRAYLEWGSECVQRLRGMFAFAIWDSAREQLTLARDPLGVKPLFYAATADSVLFASEPKGLFAHPAIECVVDDASLAELLGMWPYKSPGHGIYRGVNEVRPGELVCFERGRSRAQRYWQLTAHAHREDHGATAARVRELLTGAVDSQLGADAPVSFLLSGGLDSSGLLAIAAANWTYEYPLETFSVDFADAASFTPSAFRPDRDAPYVEYMSAALGAANTAVLLGPDSIHDTLGQALAARDLPDTGDMDASLYLLFQEVRHRFPVCLTGEGADELFGGYPWFPAAQAAAPQIFPWRRYLCFPAQLLGVGAARDLHIEEYVAQGFSDAMREVPYLPGESSVERQARAMTYLDLTRFLPGQLERKDRASMANSVEARVPYCDQELVQYVWNIPGSMKAHGRAVKIPLRDALHGLVPDKIRLRPKASYPTISDPAHEKYLRTCLQEVLSDRAWPMRDVIDYGRLAGMLAGEIAPPESRSSVWMGRIWSLYRWWDTYRPRLM